MARIELAAPPYSPAVHAAFDRIMPPGLAPLTLFRALAVSERAWSRFTAGSLLDPGPLSMRQREIVILRACARCGCEYEWGVHVSLFAKRAGLTKAKIAATLAASPQGWDQAEAALIRTVDALNDQARLTDDQFAELHRHFDADQVLEVLMLAGFYRTVAYLTGGLDLAPEPAMARFSDYA